MTAINQEFVLDRIDALHDAYGDFSVADDVVEVPSEEFPEYVANARDGYVGSAYAWTVRQPAAAGEPSETAGGEETRERALLILPRGESAWGVPGGGREGEESFPETAVREVREEAGVDCAVTDAWFAERVRWRSEDDADDRVSHTLHAFFDATYEGGTIAVQQGEVNGAAWFAERPSRLDEYARRRADAFF
jgi:8-oxo-dGTP pyrophosphatase MutT (NUDIX family)